jgi:hypothetical protein
MGETFDGRGSVYTPLNPPYISQPHFHLPPSLGSCHSPPLALLASLCKLGERHSPSDLVSHRSLLARSYPLPIHPQGSLRSHSLLSASPGRVASDTSEVWKSKEFQHVFQHIRR